VPNFGVVAAEAVRQLSQLVLNGVLETPDSIRVMPVTPMELPALRQYYYVPGTDSVLARTVANADTHMSTPHILATKRDASAAGASGATGSMDTLAGHAKRARGEVHAM